MLSECRSSLLLECMSGDLLAINFLKVCSREREYSFCVAAKPYTLCNQEPNPRAEPRLTFIATTSESTFSAFLKKVRMLQY